MFIREKPDKLLLATLVFAVCSQTGSAAAPIDVLQEHGPKDRSAQDRKIEKLLRTEQKKLREIQLRLDRLEKSQTKRRDVEVEKRHNPRAELQEALRLRNAARNELLLQSPKVKEQLGLLKLNPHVAETFKAVRDGLLKALQGLNQHTVKKAKSLDTAAKLHQKRLDQLSLQLNLHLKGAKEQHEKTHKASGKAFKNLKQLDPLIRFHVEKALKAAGLLIGEHFRGKATNKKLHEGLYEHLKKSSLLARLLEDAKKNLADSPAKHSLPKARISGAHKHSNLQKEVNALRHEVHQVRQMLEELKVHLHKKNHRLH